MNRGECTRNQPCRLVWGSLSSSSCPSGQDWRRHTWRASSPLSTAQSPRDTPGRCLYGASPVICSPTSAWPPLFPPEIFPRYDLETKLKASYPVISVKKIFHPSFCQASICLKYPRLVEFLWTFKISKCSRIIWRQLRLSDQGKL